MSDNGPVVKNDENDELPIKFNPDGTVTIPREMFEGYVQDSFKLMALEEAGVDNWEGYEAAMEMMEEYNEN